MPRGRPRKPDALSPEQWERNRIEALSTDGGRRMTLRLDGETSRALAIIKARYGHPTDRAAIEDAIMRLAADAPDRYRPAKRTPRPAS
jgi:hypothetical protein